jgi:hypothetical protein
MNKQTAIAAAAPYFKNHSVDTFYMTCDAQAFFHQSTAEGHSLSLPAGSREVFEVTRGDVDAAGDTDKQANLKAEKIEKATAKLNAAKDEHSKALEAAKAETNESKKKKAENALAGFAKKVEDAEAALVKLSGE